MAEVRGRRCDRPGCTTFVEDSPNLPVGWIQAILKVGGDERIKNNTYELCSNRCAAWLFLDRYEEIESGGKRLNRSTQTGKKRGPYKKKEQAA